MTFTLIPLNCTLGNDGEFLCISPIQTSEDLMEFFTTEIHGQLMDELDDYLNEEYRRWANDKIATLPPFLRMRLQTCIGTDTTIDEIHEYHEDVGYSPISAVPLPINDKTIMIGNEIHRVADYLKFHTLTTKDYLEYEPRCRCFHELIEDIIERLLPSEFEIEKMRIELSALQS